MSEFLQQFVQDFAGAMTAVDARRPVAVRSGEKGVFQAGIGPHAEDLVVELCLAELAVINPRSYEQHQRGVPYGPGGRSKCDLCFGTGPDWEWAVEAKLLRFLGDNGKPNGNMLMHILSPYSQDRSALTDCTKLAQSPIARRKAILIFGYHHEEWPLEPAIVAFETLASSRVRLGPRLSAVTGTLVHPVHAAGQVFAWELL
jgi:hypothetical protein